MQLLSFTQNNSTRIGLLNNNNIVDLSIHAPSLPTEMTALLNAGPDALATAQAAQTNAADFGLNDVHLESPILRPGKILAVGLNYRAHAEESNMEIPKNPIIFTKQNTSINGPFDPVHKPAETKLLDYEGELAVVIGKKCRRVPKDKAHQVIAGYCINNDVSVRDWQLRGKPPQFTMGKSWSTHCPLGPTLVIDEDLDPHALHLRTLVNGDVRQDTNTSDLIFNCFEIIEYLSTAFMLEPGDVIVTGTPSGVGMAMKPPCSLQTGDKVRVEIEGLGYIENEIIDEPADTACY
ncbi:MAG: 2-keto-4-pentenoate hydratase/2-oxohepta-3-ene-1,7-dioic acid hydratase in catechol pathway [Limisphaerales bacterium]|jgi:2-keto-4-pentenoate hydratase/2-oxohepta-3-ene-1,7-dioic acid hydratase in catechol pathway